jgi:AraC-like DNA-binding protein
MGTDFLFRVFSLTEFAAFSVPIGFPGDIQLLHEETEARLQLSSPTQDFVSVIRQIIEPLFWWGYPDVSLVAAIAGMSVRTFQRRLAEVGFTYSHLVEQVRFEIAVQRLKDPTVKLIDIAYEIGYADAAHFTRAFKRWAGVSPREFRRQKLQQQHLEEPYEKYSLKLA